MVPTPIAIAPSARYLDLIDIHPLRPIRSDDEPDRASAVVDSLLDQEQMSRDEADYLEVLSALIERYETDRHPVERATDAETLLFLTKARDISSKEVAEGTRIAEGIIIAILASKRTIALSQIERLARYFYVDSSVFTST